MLVWIKILLPLIIIFILSYLELSHMNISENSLLFSFILYKYDEFLQHKIVAIIDNQSIKSDQSWSIFDQVRSIFWLSCITFPQRDIVPASHICPPDCATARSCSRKSIDSTSWCKIADLVCRNSARNRCTSVGRAIHSRGTKLKIAYLFLALF